jgi:hypothetical protein
VAFNDGVTTIVDPSVADSGELLFASGDAVGDCAG